MRSFLTLALCSGVLQIAAGHLTAQTSENSQQYPFNQGYPYLPPIVRTPTLSLSENTYTQGESGPAYGNTMPQQPSPAAESGSAAAPPGVFNTGVTEMLSSDDLHAKQGGTSLGDYAAYVKTHPARAARVYTNADIEHLKGSDVNH